MSTPAREEGLGTQPREGKESGPLSQELLRGPPPSLPATHPAPSSPGPGLPINQDVLLMQKGMLVRKVRSKSWKKLRYFRLQDDGMTVWHARQAGGKAKPSCESRGKLGVGVLGRQDSEEASS